MYLSLAPVALDYVGMGAYHGFKGVRGPVGPWGGGGVKGRSPPFPATGTRQGLAAGLRGVSGTRD